MTRKDQPEFSVLLLHPRYWFMWLGLACWFLLAQLPWGMQRTLAKGIAKLLPILAKRRVAIASRNFEVCFPELNAEQRQQLLRENLYSTALALFETGIAWFLPSRRIEKLFAIDDLEVLKAMQGQGQGAILLVLHFTTLEIWGAGFCRAIDNIDVTYRPHDNPVYDLVQHWRRGHHNKTSEVIAAGDIRAMARTLKTGRFLAYFPDQDYGPHLSVFAPFFGIQAATISGLSRLAKMGNAKVVPLMCVRSADGKQYRMRAMPAWENYPSGDDVADATKLNAHVERCIREAPDQYLWVHRRFKTRPEGEAKIY